MAQILLCFACKGPLELTNRQYRCKACRQVFALQGTLIRHEGVEEGYGALFEAEAAATYEQRHGLDSSWSNWSARKTREAVSSVIELPVQLALEIGCGTGVHTRGYLENDLCVHLLATDLSEPMLTQAVAGTTSERVAFTVQDVHDLRIADGSIDLVAGGSILHHLLHLEECLTQIRRVLRPGGVAVFLEPLPAWSRSPSLIKPSCSRCAASRRPPRRRCFSRRTSSYSRWRLWPAAGSSPPSRIAGLRRRRRRSPGSRWHSRPRPSC